MTYPVVTDLARDGIPVKLSCRVLGFSRQDYYAWLAKPFIDRVIDQCIGVALDQTRHALLGEVELDHAPLER